MALNKKGKYINWRCESNKRVIESAMNASETMKEAAECLGLNYNTFYNQMQIHMPELCVKFEKPYVKPMDLLAAIKSSKTVTEVSKKLGVLRTSATALIEKHYPQHKDGLMKNKRITQREIDFVMNSKLSREEMAKELGVTFERIGSIRCRISKIRNAEMERQSAAFQNLTYGE